MTVDVTLDTDVNEVKDETRRCRAADPLSSETTAETRRRRESHIEYGGRPTSNRMCGHPDKQLIFSITSQDFLDFSARQRSAGRNPGRGRPHPPHELPTQKQIDAAVGSPRRTFSQAGCARKIWPRASLTSKLRRGDRDRLRLHIAVVAPHGARNHVAEA